MFTKRRISPLSSSRRSRRPGWRVSRFSMIARSDAPSAGTSSLPPVKRRSGVGTRTLIAMRGDASWYLIDRKLRRRCEQARLRGARDLALAVLQPLVQRIEFLQPSLDNDRLLDRI